VFLYLDQNYVSRITKFRLGQKDHDDFGRLHQLILEKGIIVPPSPFHVLEIHTSYLKPTLVQVFEELSQGYWVRPWQEILDIQKKSPECHIQDLLSQQGSWEHPAELSLLTSITSWHLEGSIFKRTRAAKASLCELLEVSEDDGDLPFLETLSRLLAFRSLNQARQPHDSDLADLVIAATIRPYFSWIGTDRFVRECLDRLGLGEGVFSARRREVERFCSLIQESQSVGDEDKGSGG